jgi:hypothetical protein
MKQDIAELWADKLESGEYAQGRAALRNGDKFCCLGVLCDISEQGEWVKADNSVVFKYLDKSDSIPPLVLEWAGMSHTNGFFKIDLTEKFLLSTLNDKGRTFVELAAIIRENWKQL